MLISRWLAPLSPNESQLSSLLLAEGLEVITEILTANSKVAEHRHPFTEVRYVTSGEMLFNIQGNQVLLRAGDRLEIPANTKHSQVNKSDVDCKSVYAIKAV